MRESVTSWRTHLRNIESAVCTSALIERMSRWLRTVAGNTGSIPADLVLNSRSPVPDVEALPFNQVAGGNGWNKLTRKSLLLQGKHYSNHTFQFQTFLISDQS